MVADVVVVNNGGVIGSGAGCSGGVVDTDDDDDAAPNWNTYTLFKFNPESMWKVNPLVLGDVILVPVLVTWSCVVVGTGVVVVANGTGGVIGRNGFVGSCCCGSTVNVCCGAAVPAAALFIVATLDSTTWIVHGPFVDGTCASGIGACVVVTVSVGCD